MLRSIFLSIFNFLRFAQAQLRKTGQITSISTSQSEVFALCRFSQCLQAGKTCQLLLTFLTKVTRWSRSTSNFFILWLVKIWQVSSCGKFMQHPETCLLWQLKLTEFCVNLWCFLNCLFPLNVQNEIQLLSRVFCYSWLVCLLGFWLRNTSLVKVRNPILEWHRFRFSPCLKRKRVKKSEAILALLDSFQCISNGKPE